MVLNFCVAKYFSWAAITHKIFLQLSVSQTTVCMYYWQISEHLSYTNSDLKVKFLLWFQPWFPRILMNTNKVIQQVPVSASKLCLFDIVYCLLFAVKTYMFFADYFTTAEVLLYGTVKVFTANNKQYMV